VKCLARPPQGVIHLDEKSVTSCDEVKEDCLNLFFSRNSSVAEWTAGVHFLAGSVNFSSPPHPDWLWSVLSIVFFAGLEWVELCLHAPYSFMTCLGIRTTFTLNNDHCYGILGDLNVFFSVSERFPLNSCSSRYKNIIDYVSHIRWCIRKFPDCPPGARTANVIALCH
jgi:hypothetical protein